jgi:uncharacterized protein YyaL (SSP411 family)
LLTAQLKSLERAAFPTTIPGDAALGRIVAQFREAFDARHGGFGDAPKFPRPSEILFLLREHARAGDGSARDMAVRTLASIARGGMRDHIGGGFHRYSVDAAWRVPHFEKMLYDQAQLVLAFLEAAQVSGDERFCEIADDTLQYVHREMTDSLGGFYSAEDADSIPPEDAGNPDAHKAEGAFYLWRDDEIGRLLGDDAEPFRHRYGVAPEGNAPFDPQQEFTGKNLLYIAQPVGQVAEAAGRSPDEVVEALKRARMTIFTARLARPRPYLDDKVLTAWNGLMIAAFARAARVLPAFDVSAEVVAGHLDTARRAAGFVRNRMWNAETGVLLRRYRDGHAEIDAYAEDYAFLIFGLIELFQADPNPAWLVWAIQLQRRQDELFWDETAGGWFSTTGRDPTVLLRMKEDYDGAEPTASSVSVLNLLVLSHLVQDDASQVWLDRIGRTLRLFGARLEQVGRGVPMMAAALCAHVAGLQQIVIVGDSRRQALDRIIARHYAPFAVTLNVSFEQQQALEGTLPFIAAMTTRGDEPAVYVCRDFACRAPVTDAEELDALLNASKPASPVP